MADSKISALAAISSLAAADQFAVAHSGASKSIRADQMPGYEFDYVQRTTNYTNSTGTYSVVLDGNAVTYDGSTRIKIEFFSPLFEVSGASVTANVELFDGSTDLCELSGVTANGGSGVLDLPLYGAVFLTPSNASHTYHIKAARGVSGSVLIAGGSGSGGGFAPCYMRITKA